MRGEEALQIVFRLSSSAAHGGTEAHVAQLVEHVLGKDEVTSSILVVGSTRRDSGHGIRDSRSRRS